MDFFVIERFRKSSLYDYIQTNNVINEQAVFGIGWRLVKCLQALHKAGWFHLDIKPDNVMITDDPVRGISLIDFGLALPKRYIKLRPRTAVSGSFHLPGILKKSPLETTLNQQDLTWHGFFLKVVCHGAVWNTKKK